MEFKATIHGLAEIEKLLKQLPDKPAKRALDAGLRAGGKVVQREAISRAPAYSGAPKVITQHKRKDGSVVKRILIPGLLKKSIVVRKLKEGAASVNFAIAVLGGKMAFYAHFIEWGTKFIAAQPFMRPALDAKGQEAIQVARDHTLRRIAAEAQKLATVFGTNKRRRR